MRTGDSEVGVAVCIVPICIIFGAGQSSSIDWIPTFCGDIAIFASDVLGRRLLEGNRRGEESDLIDVANFFPGNFSNSTGDAWAELSVLRPIAFGNTTGCLDASVAHEIVHDLACCHGNGKVVRRTVSTSSAIVDKLTTKDTDGGRISVVAVIGVGIKIDVTGYMFIFNSYFQLLPIVDAAAECTKYQGFQFVWLVNIAGKGRLQERPNNARRLEIFRVAGKKGSSSGASWIATGFRRLRRRRRRIQEQGRECKGQCPGQPRSSCLSYDIKKVDWEM